MVFEDFPATIGDYRILQEIGEGWSAKVYLATPLRPKAFAGNGGLLALKVFKDEALKDPLETKRIEEREFAKGVLVNHPNVIKIHEYGTDSSGRPFLVMDYVDGNQLANWVQMYHPIPESLLTRMLCEILDGLSELHSLDLLHRDLKPANIMLTNDFHAIIMDLGVILPKADATRDFTPSDQFLGSIRNSAPELLNDEEYDERADLYSFGTILYFLLFGEEIYQNENHPARLSELVNHKLPDFDQDMIEDTPVKQELISLAKKLLSKLPAERPTKATEVKASIQRVRKMPTAGPRALCAYVAAALTGLEARQREAITFLGYTAAKACTRLNIYAHQPRKATDPILNKDISPESVYEYDRKRIACSDLAIVVCNEPSFGVGQELELLVNYGVPVLLVKREGVSISRMVKGSPLNLIEVIEYQTPEELERRMIRALAKHIEFLRNKKETVTKNLGANLSQKLQQLRTRRRWTIEEAAVRYGFSPKFVHMIESTPDFFHNVGIVALTRIAAAHGITLGDLVSNVPLSKMPPPVQDDANASMIWEVAEAQGWLARDVRQFLQEYQREVANKGLPAHFTKEEIHRRHDAIQRRRLGKSGDLFA